MNVLVLALGIALAVPEAGSAADALVGTVGPGHMISLVDARGNDVTRLEPGTYTITVHDRSTEHNFRLAGPGVSQATAVESTGDAEWTVTFSAGSYSYQCDPHLDMYGEFAVGSAPPPPPPPPPPPAPPPPPPAGPTTLELRPLRLTPRPVRAGRRFTAQGSVSTDASAAVVVCAARVGGKTLAAARRRYESGRATCAWNLSRTTRGKGLTGSVLVQAGALRARRAFSLPVR